METHRRCVLAPLPSLPLFVESVGYNPDQEKIARSHGYPLYHWLQTTAGEGVIAFKGKTVALPPNSGVLMLPNVEHTYEATTKPWATMYLTFGGPSAAEILKPLGLDASAWFQWEVDTPVASLLNGLLNRAESQSDPFGLEISTDAYRFIINLSKYGQLHKNAGISRNLEALQPLLEWMESNCADPDIGLEEIAAALHMPITSANLMFRRTFELSPYAYLLHLRIRKAKELLIGRPDEPVVRIAGQVGFRDVSHFVASFRRHVGIPPQRFRKLWGN